MCRNSATGNGIIYYQLCGFEQIYLASVSSSVKCLLNFKMLFVVLVFLK